MPNNKQGNSATASSQKPEKSDSSSSDTAKKPQPQKKEASDPKPSSSSTTTTTTKTTSSVPAVAAGGSKSKAGAAASASASASSSSSSSSSSSAAVIPQKGNEVRKPVISNDPAERAILARIDDLNTKIDKCRAQLNEIKTVLDDKTKVVDGIFEGQKGVKAELGTINNFVRERMTERQKLIDQLKEARRVKKLKRDKAKEFKPKLGNIAEDQSVDATIAQIDEQIKELERTMSATALPLSEEKKLVNKIGQLNQNKKSCREYKAARDNMKQDDSVIKQLEAELTKLNAQIDEICSQRDAKRQVLDSSSNQITDAKSGVPDALKKRDELRLQIKTHQDDINTARKQLSELRQQRYQEQKAKQQEQREKEKERRKEYQEQRQQRDLERQKLEEQKLPFQDQLALCDIAIDYLQSLVPKSAPAKEEPEKHAPAVAAVANNANAPVGTPLVRDDEDLISPLNKKNKKQKAKDIKATQDIKHTVDVFLYFEELSLVPPSKVADVEKSIAEVKGKKEHYNKLAEAKLKARQEEKQNGTAKSTSTDPAEESKVASDADSRSEESQIVEENVVVNAE